MDLDSLDSRQISLILCRGRCVIGLLCIFTPGIVARIFFGQSTPALRAMTRMTGIRDLALGVGALTNLKERQQDAEWVSMGALSDGVDGIVAVATPGLPFRSRLIGVGAFGVGGYLLKLSRDLAAERNTAEFSA